MAKKGSGKLNGGKPFRTGTSGGGKKGDPGTSNVTGRGRKNANKSKLKA